ncbi:MAG: type II toxin-antitoxin system PemK/MazF family toxin [Clostridia bacterium]|nr:type II toxin-antitoxin system PemK/MazF family toxin [Clostridia bacterium]
MPYEKRDYHRGDVFLADLSNSVGSEQSGKRPVLCIQNDTGNFYAPTLIVAPITSKRFKKPLPTHYLLEDADFLSSPSLILCEQIITIDKRRIQNHLGRIGAEHMESIDEAIRVSLGLDEPIPTEIEAP